jgi:hypothetical protein
MTKLKPKHRPKRLTALLKSAQTDKSHRRSRPKRVALKIRLDAYDLKRLRSKAHTNGTTVAQELRHAIEIYLLGLTVGEWRFLHALEQRLRLPKLRAGKTLDEALWVAAKTLERLAHEEQRNRFESGRRR